MVKAYRPILEPERAEPFTSDTVQDVIAEHDNGHSNGAITDMVPVSGSVSEAGNHAGANGAEASLGLSVTQLQECNVSRLRKLALTAQVVIPETRISKVTKAQLLEVLGPLGS